jgi:hypothetical protein
MEHTYHLPHKHALDISLVHNIEATDDSYDTPIPIYGYCTANIFSQTST